MPPVLQRHYAFLAEKTDLKFDLSWRSAVRDLQRWMPEDGGESHEFHLEADSTGWDQFAVNKEKFGVETTFQEEIYTTRLDRSNCAITEKEAARLAREIEMGVASNPATNYHLLEERGIEVDDHGVSADTIAQAHAQLMCCLGSVLPPPQAGSWHPPPQLLPGIWKSEVWNPACRWMRRTNTPLSPGSPPHHSHRQARSSSSSSGPAPGRSRRRGVARGATQAQVWLLLPVGCPSPHLLHLLGSSHPLLK